MAEKGRIQGRKWRDKAGRIYTSPNPSLDGLNACSQCPSSGISQPGKPILIAGKNRRRLQALDGLGNARYCSCHAEWMSAELTFVGKPFVGEKEPALSKWKN